jgi:hypothetical protein
MKRILLTLFLCCLSSSGLADEFDDEFDSNVDTSPKALGKIGVISLLGDEFYLIHAGTVVGRNKKTYAKTSDWGVDDFAAKTANHLLTNHGYDVIFLAEQPLNLYKTYKDKSDGTLGFAQDFDAIKAELSSLKEKYTIDTFFILFRSNGVVDSHSNLPFIWKQPRRSAPAYGIYHQSSIYQLYVSTWLSIFDAKKLEEKIHRDFTQGVSLRNIVEWRKDLYQGEVENPISLAEKDIPAIKKRLDDAIILTVFLGLQKLRMIPKKGLIPDEVDAYRQAIRGPEPVDSKMISE